MTLPGSIRRGAAVALLSALLIAAWPASPAFAHESYVVEPGDTLSEIALRTGTSVSALMVENDLTSPHRIRSGQRLSIPHGSSAVAHATAAPSTASYVVAPGDTLGHIAIRLGVTRSELIAVNGISNPDLIRIGQKLAVPAGGVAPATANVYPGLPERLTSNPDRLALVPYFERWSEANGLPIDLVMAVAWQESGWNNAAVSHKGAVGIGQIMPATGDWVAADLIGRPELDTTNPEDNIRISARYLRWLIDYLGSEELALAGYYQGPGAVRAGIMYEDTERYVASVVAHRSFFLPG